MYPGCIGAEETVVMYCIFCWSDKNSFPDPPILQIMFLWMLPLNMHLWKGSHLHACSKKHAHCKNIWVTSTILWSSQLHACCVRDMLQTSRNASNLVESLWVVETLLLFVKLGSSCWKPSCLGTLLPQPCITKELLQEWIHTKKETPNLTRYANL